MVQINLLPWRELLREERRKQFFIYLAGAVVIGFGIVFLMHITIAGWIGTQEGYNSFLRREIAVVDHQIKEVKLLQNEKEMLINKINIIQTLQAYRPLVVRLFEEVVKIIPDGIHIYEITRQGNKVILIGTAESTSQISNLMRNVENSPWLENPDLEEIKTYSKKGAKLSNFKLELDIKPPEGIKNNEDLSGPNLDGGNKSTRSKQSQAKGKK